MCFRADDSPSPALYGFFGSISQLYLSFVQKLLYKEVKQLICRRRSSIMNSDFIVAVHALVYLNHKADIVSSEALAKNICTNAARVRKVMAPLKRAGFVTTREGNVGGYRFAGDASAVDLHMVADALNIRFVQSGWHSGDMDMKCLVASGMAGIMDDIFLDLDERCRERLAQISIADIDDRIFGSDGVVPFDGRPASSGAEG
ncbi:RrF2 family transcriptional regulator [Eggerthella lenta]|nr:Rrf2 family transcriptional regulator [Eggerthella lenta]